MLRILREQFKHEIWVHSSYNKGWDSVQWYSISLWSLWGNDFFSRPGFLRWFLLRYLFHPPFYCNSTQKTPSHSAKSAGGRLQPNTNTPKPSWMCVDYAVHAVIAWEPLRETSSHATCQGTLVHSHLSLLCHCELILDLKEWNWCSL